MRAETESRIERWESRPTDGGYAGLHALIDAGFSGAITAGGTWLFALDGRPIGLFGGPMESFATASATAYVAPHPALPILFAMQESDGERTARYYTDDTPLSETAETLASGGFTGYVELSENVLSGEYYLVYHRGRSIEVAFVGEGDRLLTDERARTRANEEVGIYEVTAVTLAELELPAPPESKPKSAASEPSRSAGSAGGETARNEASSADAVDPADGGVSPAETSTTDPGETATDPGETATDPDSGPDANSTSGVDDPATVGRHADDAVGRGGDPSRPRHDPGGTAGTIPTAEPGSTGASGTDDESETDAVSDATVGTGRAPVDGSTGRSAATDRWGSVVEDPVEDRLAAERRWRETARTRSAEPERGSIESPVSRPETRGGPEASNSAPEDPRSVSEDSRPEDGVETERRAREAVEAEADRLREEVASLRERLETLETAGASDDSTEGLDSAEELRAESITPAQALSETDLFVRYARAGGPTLEAARSGAVDRTAVDDDLRLERHTGFDPTGVLVEGRPFAAFLEGRIEHRFADWVVRSLPFDIEETGHERGLERLYDALPEIDRIDFGGTVDAEDVDAGEGEELQFDVVLRSRMGEALIVADCVDSREPVDEERVASLVSSATAAREAEEALAGAMLVTTSFFDPGALGTAAEATRSGLLGRNARESYVTLSRRRGYHLCLVEMRDAFHVRVPEL